MTDVLRDRTGNGNTFSVAQINKKMTPAKSTILRI